MARITKISLGGYKGLSREYRPGPATILTGPNGSGKSACLEALQYALDGYVPGGRSPEIIAKYFPPEGGTIQIWDSDGRWVRRGIGVSKGGKISEILETTHDD